MSVNRFQNTLAEIVTHDPNGDEIQFIKLNGGSATGGNFQLSASTAREVEFLVDAGVMLQTDKDLNYNIAFGGGGTITVPAATVVSTNRKFVSGEKQIFFVKQGTKMSLISGSDANVNLTLVEYKSDREISD
ncbi:hypothetical protein [Prochlorococcus sp. ALOHA_ZT_50]|jgi:hypothetical protein|uniref:hypothetical protein n=1 Tax=Prochlorococcus sp. ALOHA_ZT_50 TaxID=2919303 RepID=UPI00257FBC8E|nr:hypothetical protein [Prochlorococcus sp. ALOHA_ZT_50]MCH2079582.1 hypothetical protein [Prochlorococcus sp. ALOHA_ZT_50]